MKSTTNTRRILVLGGNGYIGRHIVKHLNRFGADVVTGTRAKYRNVADNEVRLGMHTGPSEGNWHTLVKGYDIVINTVGILRERFNESYEQVHHSAVAELAAACRESEVKLIHISALGLNNPVKSRFLLSKRRGEEALKRSGADWYIVRPSLVDGEGGFGARWFRRVAGWPLHMVPASATGRVAPINVDDLGEAVARLALLAAKPVCPAAREFDLGGDEDVSIPDYLQALAGKPPLARITIPAILARLTAHICDAMHITPYSFGHHELLKFDNLPAANRLAELLDRPARKIGPNRLIGDRAGIAIAKGDA